MISVDHMTGKKFGRLLVLSIERGKGMPPIAHCSCDCGRLHSARAYHIRDEKIRSCGCLNNELRIQRTYKDISGQKFGRLLVISRGETKISRSRQSKTFWNCLCDCGKEKSILASHLQSGRTISCGCFRIEVIKDKFTEDLSGQIFNRLTVLRRSDKGSRVKWICKCSCGEVVDVNAHTLKSGVTNSCGCYSRDMASEKNSRPLKEGYRSGLLTVVKPVTKEEIEPYRKSLNTRCIYYLCKCECGNEKILSSGMLRGGSAQISCGCMLNKGGDSFERFQSDPGLAASKCFLYLAETIYYDCVKLGIAKDPDARARDSRGVYTGWRLKIPMRRDMAWLIEHRLLSETKKYLRRPSGIKSAWAGWTELRRDVYPNNWYIDKIKSHQRDINAKGFKIVCIESMLALN